MIRLLVAVVVCLALHPAATGAAYASERAIVAAAGGEHVAVPPSVDWHFDGVMAASVSLAPVLGIVAPVGAWRSHRVVARLWLRGQRLLC